MNVLEIKFFRQPTVGMFFRFRLQREDGTLSFSVLFSIGSFIIGSTLAQTLNTICDILNSSGGANFSFTVVGDSIFANYTGEYYLTLTNVAQELDYFHLYYIDVQAQGFAPFNIDLFSVEVNDTYENTRTLVEHFSKKDTVNLTWDGGDALYQPMMASALDFSMQVPNAVDGYFLHLLTGDEKRYFVRLKNHDTNGGTQLLWQGFILPDLYKEPYKNGALFVDFTAVDMLASLKGKTFEPWFYSATFTLPEILGYILAETGLQQEMYVKNMMENYRDGEPFEWRYINLTLKPFIDGDDYSDLYVILESILNAQGLQILSFRGKWILQGFTRRQEASGIAEVYYPDGVYKETVTLNHDVVNPLFNPTPIVIGETPYNSVAINFESETGDNLFTDDVVLLDYYTTRYRYDADIFDTVNGFVTGFNAAWNKINLPMCNWSNGEKQGFEYSWDERMYPVYQVNEAVALVNYFECKQQPYVKQGRRFELDIEANCSFLFTIRTLQEFISDIEGTGYDATLLFQVLLNGREFLSNRPGFSANRRLQFTKRFIRELPENLPYHRYMASFTLKYEFVIPEDGVLTFRFLPAFGSSTRNGNVLLGYAMSPQVLKITAKDNVAKEESAVALRPVNTTMQYSGSISYIASPDASLVNNFGYGRRVFDRYLPIPITAGIPISDVHYRSVNEPDSNFFPTTGTALVAAYLLLTQHEVDYFWQDFIFRLKDGNKAVLLKKADGSKMQYPSLYTKTYRGRYYIVAYNSFSPVEFGLPFLPDGYTELPVIGPGDALSYMVNLTAVENVRQRELWKIYGFTDYTLKTYAKTMAYAYHCTRPATIFNIDATALKLVWPLQRVLFRYLGQNRYFLPVRYKLNLFGGKTELTMKEAILTELNDVSYE